MDLKIAFVVGIAALGLCFASAGFGYDLGNLEITPKAVSRLAYDDNITYAADNEKADMRADLGLGLALRYEAKLTSLNAGVDVTRQFYDKYSDFNNTSVRLNAGINHELSKYSRLGLSENFTRAEEPRSFEDAFGQAANRYKYSQNGLRLTYNHDSSKQQNLEFGYKNDIFDYSGDSGTDSVANSLYGLVLHALSSQNSIIGYYQLFRRDYDNIGHVWVNGLQAGLRHYFTAQFYADLRAGYDFIHTITGQNTGGANTTLSVINDLDELTQFSFSYTNNRSSSYYSTDLQDSQRLSLAARKQLRERLGGSAAIFYGLGEYESSDIEDESQGLNLSLSYDISERSVFNLSYTFSNTDSNIASREYTKNVVLLGYNIDF